MGIYERDTDYLRVFIVKNRTKEVLTKLITDNVKPGTHIITDNWPSYTGLEDLGFTHEILNKSEIKREKKLSKKTVKKESESENESEPI